MAVGSADLSLTDTTFVKGSLIKPVELTPAVIPPPPNTHAPGCVPSLEVSWVLEKFEYNLTSTPLWFENGYGGPTPYEALEIVIRNTANNLTVRCGNRADSINLDYFAYPYPRWELCDQPDPSTVAYYAPYPVQTYVNIDRLRNIFGVNQTWYCADKDGGPPYASQFPPPLALLADTSNSTPPESASTPLPSPRETTVSPRSPETRPRYPARKAPRRGSVPTRTSAPATPTSRA